MVQVMSILYDNISVQCSVATDSSEYDGWLVGGLNQKTGFLLQILIMGEWTQVVELVKNFSKLSYI